MGVVEELRVRWPDDLPWPPRPKPDDNQCIDCHRETYNYDRRYVVFDLAKKIFRWQCSQCHDKEEAV